MGSFFGSGAEVAVVRALCLEAGLPASALEAVGTPGDGTVSRFAPEAQRVLAVFRAWYPAHCEIQTRPYPGVPELLRALRARGLRTAVVSNKLDAAVQSLTQRHFPGLFDAALGEREPELRRKPAPDMTLAALARMGAESAEAVYVGDSEIDLLSAENAGMDCVSVAWGFRSREFLAAHSAAVIVEDPAALLDVICAGREGV